MTVAALLLVFLIIGVVLAFLPVDSVVRNLILAIVVVVSLVWLRSALGVLPAVRLR